VVDSRPEHIKKIGISLDPTKIEERERNKNESIEKYENTFGSLDSDGSYAALFELLWYSQMPCFDVKGLTSEAKDELSFLKRCYWKGHRINCNAIFQQHPTDRGMCCAFNKKEAEDVFKMSKYRDAISAMQTKDANDAFESNELPEWYNENNEPKPEAGRDKGLTLVVDGHSNKQSAATVKDNYRGFVTLVDGSDKFPLVSLGQLFTRPGWENNINVGAINLEARNEIRSTEPAKRNCYFPDEYNLQIHQRYSQFNCLFECRADFASRCINTCSEPNQVCHCKNATTQTNEGTRCIPWFYPVNNETPYKMCNPWNTEKFLQIIKEQVPKDECKHCLPDCETTIYQSTMTYTQLRKCDRTNLGGSSILCSLVDEPLNPAPWTNAAQNEFARANQTLPWYLETNPSKELTGGMKFPNQRLKVLDPNKKSSLLFPSEVEENPWYDAFEMDIGIVNIFFGTETILNYEARNRMSNVEFLSQIGGTLGLAMGVSIISVIEIVYWLIIRLLGRIID